MSANDVTVTAALPHPSTMTLWENPAEPFIVLGCHQFHRTQGCGSIWQYSMEWLDAISTWQGFPKVCPWIIHFNRLFPCFSIINHPFWGIPIHGKPQLSLAIKQTRRTKHRKNLQKESQQNALMSNDFSMAPKPAAKSWPLSISQKQHVIICYNML